MLIWKRSWNNPATSQLTTFECMLDAHIIHINVHSLANLANNVTCSYITYIILIITWIYLECLDKN